ncbi:MAG: MmcQ/YjbR family DNA-binding protein [Streptosporangiales bacterium]|nr:MmcQ/YjbR family DNA-binding protein [Streptosporangiales bacterium]
MGRVGVGGVGETAAVGERPEVPEEWVRRLGAVLEAFPECVFEDAWVGVRWRVGQATVAHVFGGEDQLYRITFRAASDEVMAFQQLGPPYFKTEWGHNVVGLLLDDATDWDELAELLTDSYCIQAPARLAEQVARPGGG